MRSPSVPVTVRLRIATQPYADTGSAASARSHASSIVVAIATPHGLPCFTITTAGSVSSRATRRAPSRSARLLYESSLPPSCSTRESRCLRAPTSQYSAAAWCGFSPYGRSETLRNDSVSCSGNRSLRANHVAIAAS